MNVYDIKISDLNSCGIRHEADRLGITHARRIGGGYAEGHEGEADYYIGFYALPIQDGGEARVANTNGDPVWEDEDPQGFAELAEWVGAETG